MLHCLSEKLAVYFFDNNDKYPFEVYVYGIELTLSSLLGMILILLLGLFSGFFIESIIFMISLSTIRFFSGGYHATSYLRCNIILFVSYIFVLLLYQYHVYVLNKYTYIIAINIFSIIFIVLAIFAPVKTECKDFSQYDYYKYKIISIVLTFIVLILFILFYEFLCIKQVIVILPTIMVVSISILAEIVLQKRRNSIEKLKTKIKENG